MICKYIQLKNEITSNERVNNAYCNSAKMSPEEKFVSFLNNCFVFKKIRNVDEVNIEKIFTNETVIQEKETIYETKKIQNSSKNATKNKSIATKLKKKIKLVMNE